MQGYLCFSRVVRSAGTGTKTQYVDESQQQFTRSRSTWRVIHVFTIDFKQTWSEVFSTSGTRTAACPQTVICLKKTYILLCDAVRSVRNLPTFRRNIVAPYSGSKSKRIKQVGSRLLFVACTLIRKLQAVRSSERSVLPDYMASHPTIWHSSHSPTREPQS
jgi:hypothetical protein